MNEEKLTANMEDYLETIGDLIRENGVVRVKEIGEARGVTPPSVHAALHLLVDKGLIEHEHYGYIRLTKAGAEMARKITDRHKVLEEFLRDFLCVPAAIASDDACQMEHVVSEVSLEKLENFLRRLQSLPPGLRESLCRKDDDK